MAHVDDQRARDSGQPSGLPLPPIEMLLHALLLNAHRKQASRIELTVEPHPEGLASCVHFVIEGDRQLEISPPNQMHDVLVDALEAMSHAGHGGRCWVLCNDEFLCGLTITIHHPLGAPRAVTIDVHAPATEDSGAQRGPVRVTVVPVIECC